MSSVYIKKVLGCYSRIGIKRQPFPNYVVNITELQQFMKLSWITCRPCTIAVPVKAYAIASFIRKTFENSRNLSPHGIKLHYFWRRNEVSIFCHCDATIGP